MRPLIALAIALMLFGCLGGETPAPSGNGQVVSKPPKTETTVSVIIEGQTNQTATVNPEINENETGLFPEIPDNRTMIYEYDPNATLGIYFINASNYKTHGDAVLIKKGNLDILIDAASAEKAGAVVDLLKSREVDDIEVLISTNADPRRYGGINAVADNFEIEEFWWGGGYFGDPDYKAIVQRMDDESKLVRIIGKGDSTELNGIGLEILNPDHKDPFGDVNNDAIVTRMTQEDFSLLLTSGIQKGGLQKLVNTGAKVKNRIIQAPSFGTGEGTSDIGIFLLNAKPEIMIVTGSPVDSAEMGGSREPFFRLLEQYGIDWITTYENGTLKVTTDGSEYNIEEVEVK